MITTTLNRIRSCDPKLCEDSWVKLLKGLGKTSADDEPLPFAEIVRINGLYDALWCCQSAPEYSREWRLFSVWCVRQVQHLMTDPKSVSALDVSERYANGMATKDELAAAADAAAAVAEAAIWTATKSAWAAAEAAAATAQQVQFLLVVS